MTSTIEEKVIEINNLKKQFIELSNKYKTQIKQIVRQYLTETTAPIRAIVPTTMTVELSFSVQIDDEGSRVFYVQLLLEEERPDGRGSAEVYKNLTPHNLNYPLNSARDGYTDKAGPELMKIYEQYVEAINKFTQFLDELDVVGENSLLEPETYIVIN